MSPTTNSWFHWLESLSSIHSIKFHIANYLIFLLFQWQYLLTRNWKLVIHWYNLIIITCSLVIWWSHYSRLRNWGIVLGLSVWTLDFIVVLFINFIHLNECNWWILIIQRNKRRQHFISFHPLDNDLFMGKMQALFISKKCSSHCYWASLAIFHLCIHFLYSHQLLCFDISLLIRE